MTLIYDPLSSKSAVYLQLEYALSTEKLKRCLCSCHLDLVLSEEHLLSKKLLFFFLFTFRHT